MDIGAVIASIVGAVVVLAGAWKIKQDNDKARLVIEANAETVRLKIETDAATVKLEIEAAAAKLKLETEAATALALAESQRQLEAERAQVVKELAEFRAEQDEKLAKQELELEEYRIKRAQFETTNAALNAQIVKELGVMTTGMGATKKAVGSAERRIIAAGDDGRTRLMNFIFDLLELYMKDPPATAEQIDRFMEATQAGDTDKAQDIKDEGQAATSIKTEAA